MTSPAAMSPAAASRGVASPGQMPVRRPPGRIQTRLWSATVPEPLAGAVRALRSDLAGDPFRAPEADGS